MPRRPITLADVVEGLRALADEYETGYRPVPAAGQTLRRVAGVPVVPIVVHDALCGWRVATGQDEAGHPEVLACAGCGLGYLLDEARGRP